ncbi:hypothetical protein NA57DRAFT_71114 [Rhizodiscina lignyota]|uniref:Uncharacterized protein n=1 Tax=Rhizodiscina lignyota TaxID=1504668 RepID=A0A9P4IRV6_9PEZI|nr:hypothetical protein NA57DRAFT_71114 [Rhizodiscina lignyota]
MMVPRAYTLQRRQSKGDVKVSEKGISFGSALEIPRPRSAPVVVTTKKVQKEEKMIRGDKDDGRSRPTTPTRMASEPVSVPSKPVVIPPRSPSLTAAGSPRRRNNSGSRRSSRPVDDRHNSRAIPASVAALLAVTSIPPPNPNASQRRRTSGTRAFHKTSIDDLLQEWREDDYGSSSNSLGAGSPMDILLERADESDIEDVSGRSLSLLDNSMADNCDYLSSRSVSSDSIPSIPDLVHEDRSPASLIDPRTPSIRSRRVGGSAESRSWKDKIVSSPAAEECHHDHPLLSSPTLEESPMGGFLDFNASLLSAQRSKSSARAQPKSSFKSNLTASLNAFASSFRSFSNFTAPSIPPDDLLSRSFFAPTSPQRFATEMRPKSSDGIPDPALRRYLNPTPRPERERQAHQRRLSLEEQHISDLSLHQEPDFAAAVNASSSLNAAIEFEGPMIPMQTYGPGPRGSVRGKRNKRLPPTPTSKNLNTEAGRIAKAGLLSDEVLRQREPRENSDFLRVIVLEMNMRREGKLDAKGLGRAKVWLPPRKAIMAARQEEEAVGGMKKIPVRWVGVAIDDA